MIGVPSDRIEHSHRGTESTSTGTQVFGAYCVRVECYLILTYSILNLRLKLKAKASG